MILFLSFCADRDNLPLNGLACFLDIIFIYVLKVTVMTVTWYDLISIKDLQAARKKFNLKKIDSQYLLKTLNFNYVSFHNNVYEQ